MKRPERPPTSIERTIHNDSCGLVVNVCPRLRFFRFVHARFLLFAFIERPSRSIVCDSSKPVTDFRYVRSYNHTSATATFRRPFRRRSSGETAAPILCSVTSQDVVDRNE